MFHFGTAFAQFYRVKLIVKESTMQNQFFKTAWAEPPRLSQEKGKVMPPGNLSISDETRLIGNAACDWHGICNNAGCPTKLDWQAI
tara:strand:+ start:143 stop:400 length:258 start_codon:yes stop_codon:yes gene_type:complete